MGLRVLTRFPGGNARVLAVRDAGASPEIEFAPEPDGGSDPYWFCFRVAASPETPPPAERLKLTLRFFQPGPDSGPASGLRPVYQPQGQGWFRLGSGLEQTRPDGQTDLSWTIPYPAPETEVAFCFPYTRAELETLVRKSGTAWNEDPIGVSTLGRLLPRLSSDPGTPGGHTAGLYVAARRYALETPGAWLLDGFLDRIGREKKGAFTVWAVPFLDLDGSPRATAGTEPGSPAPEGLPSERAARLLFDDVKRWAARCRPRVFIEFVAGGAEAAGGICCPMSNPDGREELPRETAAWANAIAAALGPAFAAQPFLRPAATPALRACAAFAANIRQATSASALVLAAPFTACNGTLMTPKQYREAGRLVARAALERSRHTG